MEKKKIKCSVLPIEVAIIMVVAHAKRDNMEAKENALADRSAKQVALTKIMSPCKSSKNKSLK